MLRRLFPSLAPAPKPLPQPDSQLALGALLVRIAFADRHFQASEVAAIDRILQATFGLGPLDAAKLRAQCTDLEMHSADPDEFARILREEVDYSERRAMAHAMWQVVMADGERDDLEETVLHEVEDALAITPEDSQAARSAALGVTD